MTNGRKRPNAVELFSLVLDERSWRSLLKLLAAPESSFQKSPRICIEWNENSLHRRERGLMEGSAAAGCGLRAPRPGDALAAGHLRGRGARLVGGRRDVGRAHHRRLAVHGTVHSLAARRGGRVYGVNTIDGSRCTRRGAQDCWAAVFMADGSQLQCLS